MTTALYQHRKILLPVTAVFAFCCSSAVAQPSEGSATKSAAEFEIFSTALTATSFLVPNEKVRLVVFKKSDMSRIEGADVTVDKPSKSVKLPTDTELVIRIASFKFIAGASAYCSGEATATLSGDETYKSFLNFRYVPKDPDTSTCEADISRYDLSGNLRGSIPIEIKAGHNETPIVLPIKVK